MSEVLCQDCLRVRAYTDERHQGVELCECGGEFCGCESCNAAIDALRNKKDFTLFGVTPVDVSNWSEVTGLT